MLNEYKEDLELHQSGSPIVMGAYTFYLRRWGTKESIKVQKSLLRRLFGPLHECTESDSNTVIAYWLVEYGIAGWEGVVDDEGNDVPYSKDAAEEIFLDDAYELSLNVELFNAATKWENYLIDQSKEVIEAIKKS